jgi:hypothetical protein
MGTDILDRKNWWEAWVFQKWSFKSANDWRIEGAIQKIHKEICCLLKSEISESFESFGLCIIICVAQLSTPHCPHLENYTGTMARHQ